MGSRSQVQDRPSDALRRGVNDPIRRSAPSGALGQIIVKLQKLERQLSGERGRFDLFGLFLREGAADRWDVVAAAPWFGEDKRHALELLAARLKGSVGASGMMMISRIVPLAHHDRFLQAVRELVNVEHGLREISDVDLAGVQIERGYVITCQTAREASRV